jgi:hypothetical protein
MHFYATPFLIRRRQLHYQAPNRNINNEKIHTNIANKMKKKKYYTIGTVPTYSNTIVERGKIDNPNTQIYDRSPFWLDNPNTQIHDRSPSLLDNPNTQIHDCSPS